MSIDRLTELALVGIECKHCQSQDDDIFFHSLSSIAIGIG
jgi:hypothetical protein